MPRLSAWFVRASLVYLALGFTLGGLMLANEGFQISSALDHLLPAHIEFLLAGWLVQLAMGVAYWILPRFASGPPRGSEKPVWISFLLFNAGILLVASTAFVSVRWINITGRFVETAGTLLFVFGAWRRVKPAGK